MLRVSGAFKVSDGVCRRLSLFFHRSSIHWDRALHRRASQQKGFYDRIPSLTPRAVLTAAVTKRAFVAISPSTWCLAMTLEAKCRFLLLYASEKGQAKAIAEEITEKADGKGFVADLHCLSQLEEFNLEKEGAPVVIIASTTGSGELPGTAKKFFQEICGISAPHHYAHIKYTVLALGDSSYTFFAHGGKMIDEQLQRLGADHFYATGYADDSVGLELVVDPWIDGLWDTLKNVCQKQEERNSDGERMPDTNDGSRINKLDVNSPGLSTEIQLLRLDTSVSAVAENSIMTSENLEQNTLVAGSQEHYPVPAWVPSEKPLSEAPLTIPTLPIEYINVEFQKYTEQDSSQGCFSLAPDFPVFQVPVTKAITLTREDAVKTALFLELDISNTSITYQPGDAFSVICPNSESEVEYLIQRLGLGDKRDHIADLSIRPNSKRKGARLPDYIPKRSTLQFILTWCLEIRAVPKKACLRALVEYISDPSEKRRLQELSSRQGAADYNRYIRDFNVCLLDILRSLPSCHPPFSLLVEHLPKLQARSYSAASSSKYYPGKLHFVFNIVEFPSTPVQPIARRGVCTGWLAQQVTAALQSYDSEATIGNSLSNKFAPTQISIFSRQNTFFHLPSDTAVPIIMVGPGTGIAPFIGFLQHRQKQREEYPECTFGETWLFYGCRHCDRDYLFRKELRHFLSNGTLTQLKVCFSRDTTDGKPKYVQHLLQHLAHEVTKILLSENGYLYVCGFGLFLL
ncbi:methionine synthase reductase isoform X2 [Pristis pectinata]|uniref:methionine synthase reductase isoform X2 n=1 Tax=Pristis pectinata TaxID=685728 RepID=UPI00223D95E9|nr:methionine synthase reductase isoform X2 [Pristis pectinata]